MSSIAVTGSATGTGVISLLAPVTNTNRTINLPDSNGTIVTSATAGVPINGPAFSAYADATTQTFVTSTYTKVLFQTEEFDTNSCFASSRFTPTVAGYYQVNAQALFAFGASTGTSLVSVYKNGAVFKEGSRTFISSASSGANVISILIYLNGSTDYAEIYAQQASGVNQNLTGGNNKELNYFQAAMIRSAV